MEAGASIYYSFPLLFYAVFEICFCLLLSAAFLCMAPTLILLFSAKAVGYIILVRI